MQAEFCCPFLTPLHKSNQMLTPLNHIQQINPNQILATTLHHTCRSEKKADTAISKAAALINIWCGAHLKRSDSCQSFTNLFADYGAEDGIEVKRYLLVFALLSHTPAFSSTNCSTHDWMSEIDKKVDVKSMNKLQVTNCTGKQVFFSARDRVDGMKHLKQALLDHFSSSQILRPQNCTYKKGSYPSCLPSVIEQIMVGELGLLLPEDDAESTGLLLRMPSLC